METVTAAMEQKRGESMLQLVNLSNYRTDLDLIENSGEALAEFLEEHGLDGVEMMFCGPWDAGVHRKEWIHGVHLNFWPSWLDFWRGNSAELMRQFGSEENIRACYGGLNREDWLQTIRENIRQAKEAEADYVVWHVCHNRLEEVVDWQFSASDREVAAAAVSVINSVADELSPDMTLLLENLWWPGLTLLDREVVAMLLERVNHPRVGIMLDTGHLMNTNQSLEDEKQGVEYVLKVLADIGEYRKAIQGIHLHHSLSGNYVREMQRRGPQSWGLQETISHVMKIDQHLPFGSRQAERIVEWVQPEWLVHEFVQKSPQDWAVKVARQQRAIGVKGEDG